MIKLCIAPVGLEESKFHRSLILLLKNSKRLGQSMTIVLSHIIKSGELVAVLQEDVSSAS